jgi:2-octaprenylphenol hydroxylase
MADPQRFDVVIVGAGIAGSALAASLSGSGARIALVEPRELHAGKPQAAPAGDYDPRVSALTLRSRAQLEKLGAWQAIVDYRYCPYHHMSVWEADGTGAIDFDSDEVNAGELGYIVENRAITGALLARVDAAPDVTVFSPAALADCRRLDAGDLQVQLDDGRILETTLAVAADGAQSRLRELMGFAVREWGYGQRAIVTTARVSEPHQHTAWQRFLPTGPLAFLPLASAADGDRFCSIVWSLDEALVDDLLALDDAAFCAALGEAIEWRLGDVAACARRFAFPLRQSHAVDYVQPGVALVADAAHTIHPLAGQGINIGLHDVAVLAEEIRRALEHGASPGALSVLQRYQRRRKGENLLMMAAMEGFKRLFEQQALPLRWLRNAGMRRVAGMGPLKREIMRRAMGVDTP